MVDITGNKTDIKGSFFSVILYISGLDYGGDLLRLENLIVSPEK